MLYWVTVHRDTDQQITQTCTHKPCRYEISSVQSMYIDIPTSTISLKYCVGYRKFQEHWSDSDILWYNSHLVFEGLIPHTTIHTQTHIKFPSSIVHQRLNQLHILQNIVRHMEAVCNMKRVGTMLSVRGTMVCSSQGSNVSPVTKHIMWSWEGFQTEISCNCSNSLWSCWSNNLEITACIHTV